MFTRHSHSSLNVYLRLYSLYKIVECLCSWSVIDWGKKPWVIQRNDSLQYVETNVIFQIKPLTDLINRTTNKETVHIVPNKLWRTLLAKSCKNRWRCYLDFSKRTCYFEIDSSYWLAICRNILKRQVSLISITKIMSHSTRNSQVTDNQAFINFFEELGNIFFEEGDPLVHIKNKLLCKKACKLILDEN